MIKENVVNSYLYDLNYLDNLDHTVYGINS